MGFFAVLFRKFFKPAGLNYLGMLTFFLYLSMTVLSQKFNWGEGYGDRPILSYIFLYTVLFIVYIFGVAWILKPRENFTPIWPILFFGLLFRIAILPANQIQEDDVYRYLWDGKVFAHGVNPYKYPPGIVNDYKRLIIREPEAFLDRFSLEERNELDLLYNLKWENDRSVTFIERINHPDVPTIYPPLAQFVFRIVCQIAPDSIMAMRLGFLVFDLIAFGFIVLTLKSLGKNPSLCLIYFWSPLIVKETFNSTHLDIIGISLLCGSIYFLIRRLWTWALAFLALGVAGKFYPAILFPLYIREMIYYCFDGRPSFRGLIKIVYSVMIFLGVIIICYLPFQGAGERIFTGLKTFTTFWQNNDSLFAIMVFIFKTFFSLEQGFTLDQESRWLSYDLATFLSKITIIIILTATVLFYAFFRLPTDSLKTVRHCFIVMALVFLLSPVQNPWYLSWLVPFFCFFPSRAWLLLTGLIGFYYIDFYFDYQQVPEYGVWLPWLEYTPFYFFLGFEYWRNHMRINTDMNSES